MFNKIELKKTYDANLKSYLKVCKSAKKLAKKILTEKKINLLNISYRVKSFESFYEKLSRKKYKDPYLDVEDICGLRIVCFYPRELERVREIIQEIFLIKDYIDKTGLHDIDRFGYRSNHHIVSLPNTSRYSNYTNYKIEIQSRTILMHAWAHFQGNLEYKKTEHIPKEFRRKLFRLSAVLELVEEDFQSLKIEKNALRELHLTENFEFSRSTELNIDTFMSYLNITYPKRRSSYRFAKLLMKELLKNNIGFDQVIECSNNARKYLRAFEQETDLILTQEEALKVLLCINNKVTFKVLKDDPLISQNIDYFENNQMECK
jgi:ppGpp synthetase/RelA/SpoT-type nucleotidyltranferase